MNKQAQDRLLHLAAQLDQTKRELLAVAKDLNALSKHSVINDVNALGLVVYSLMTLGRHV